jgi:RecA/RadA recombinase
MDFIKSFVKELNDENISILDEAVGAAEFSGYIDTGCYILNAILSGSIYGGVSDGRITIFAGESSTGKSFFSLALVKNFLDSDPRAMVIYFDTEAAATKNMAMMRGIDAKRVILAEPETVEQLIHMMTKMLNNYIKEKEEERRPLLMVLDSVGMLSTEKEVKDVEEGKDVSDMTKARGLKKLVRLTTSKLGKLRVPFIVTNHVYQKINAYVPTNTMGGGLGLLFAASSVIELSKKKDKEGTEVVGSIIKAKVYKSRIAKENSVAEMKLNYETGLDKYYGLLDLAEKHGIVKKLSTRYEFPDGTKEFAKTIYKNPEKYFTKEIMDKLDDAAHKEYSYWDIRQEETEDGAAG